MVMKKYRYKLTDTMESKFWDDFENSIEYQKSEDTPSSIGYSYNLYIKTKFNCSLLIGASGNTDDLIIDVLEFNTEKDLALFILKNS